MLITVEKLKENFEKEGKTLASWARENGYQPREVYLVVGGRIRLNTARVLKLRENLG